jgi:ubiquinone/menaquinone biosynthesis C-methylase UbiE
MTAALGGVGHAPVIIAARRDASAMRSMTPEEQREAVAMNVRAYRKMSRKYDASHGEIFNPVEQVRLRGALERAVADVGSGGASPLRALDVGSGTGNVTRHLVELGLEVTAADVSPELLRVVADRLPGVETRQLDGLGLGGIDDESFDVVTAYSVLHHVPDYLGMVDEIVRVLRPGGIVYLDHEASDEFWRKDGCLADFERALRSERESRPGWWNPDRKRWQRFLIPSRYLFHLKLRYRPEAVWCVEGDIHTWDFDHVEWNRVEERLELAGTGVVGAEEYLVYHEAYPRRLWESYRERCSDMRCLVARKQL